MIELPPGTRSWLAAGVTDMRRGFPGLSAEVQTVLEQQPYSGHVFIFRGRRGDNVKCLWFDGDGLCLLAKRLKKGTLCVAEGRSGTVHSHVRNFRCCSKVSIVVEWRGHGHPKLRCDDDADSPVFMGLFWMHLRIRDGILRTWISPLFLISIVFIATD